MQVNEQDFKTKFLVPVIDYQRCLLMIIWKLNDKEAILSQAEGAFCLLRSVLDDSDIILIFYLWFTVQHLNLLQRRLNNWRSAEIDGTAKGR